MLYEDVLQFIQYLIKKRIHNKTFNVVANSNVVIKDLIKTHKYTSQTGSYKYAVSNVNAIETYKTIPNLNKSSLQNIEIWRMNNAK